jgi:hypothetical protein
VNRPNRGNALVGALWLLLRDEKAVGSRRVTRLLVRRVSVSSPASDIAVACVWALDGRDNSAPRPTSFR